jgi:hypothetical protein
VHRLVKVKDTVMLVSNTPANVIAETQQT